MPKSVFWGSFQNFAAVTDQTWKCTEMYLKFLSTDVKAESDNSLRDQCFVLTNH